MRYKLHYLAILLFSVSPLTLLAQTEENFSEPTSPQSYHESFHPFTGQITGDRVRLRSGAHLDSAILHEFYRNDLIHVVGEEEEFCQVTPPSGIKGYVFRSYVLDGIVEGSRVNIRLSPSTDAPIIGQLEQGQSVTGIVSPNHSKWLEIQLPETVKFYICKEFVENKGPESIVLSLEEMRKSLPTLLNAANFLSYGELDRDFEMIDYQKIQTSFENILSEYGQFKEFKDTILRSYRHIQDVYLTKKISHLESKARATQAELNQTAIARAENTFSNQPCSDFVDAETEKDPSPITLPHPLVNNLTPVAHQFIADSYWIRAEQDLFNRSLTASEPIYPTCTFEEYYKEQQRNARVITGVLESYLYPLQTRPGDYLLRDLHGVPLAYIYSTYCDLQTYAGKTARFHLSSRPNHSYALPAYFVLAVHAQAHNSPIE